MEEKLDQRTRYMTVVLEDVYQPQNASAVVRTSECLGIQDVHIIENHTDYQVNKYVLRGSHQWMNVVRYRKKGEDNAAACINTLRENGYRIYVTDPDPTATPIDQLDMTAGKIALVFGNELRGASHTVLAQADGKVTIPMYGFTESFNLSVSVAICLHSLLSRLRQTDVDYALTADERDALKLMWYRKIIRNAPMVEKRFLRSIV